MICPLPALLAADPTTTAIIGTNPVRCYLAGNIPQVQGIDPNANIPCVTWQVVAGTTENLLSDPPPVDYVRVRIVCWAMTFIQADALGDAVRAALLAGGSDDGLNPDIFEPDTKRYAVTFDFKFIVARP
jgi:hypothetical protein